MKRWLILTVLILLFFGTSFKYGFSQDDWYFLKLSNVQSTTSVLQFFSPWHQGEFPFYRPLSTQFFYFVSVRLFGLGNAPYFMHSVIVIAQILSGYLVYRLSRTLGLSRLRADLAAFVYVGGSLHFLSFYYIAAAQQLFAAMFGLATLLAALRRKSFWLIGGLYILALLSKESALLIPVYLFILSPWEHRFSKLIRSKLQYLTVPGILAVLYVLLRLIRGVMVQSEYHLKFGFENFSALKVCLSYFLGFFERISDYSFAGGLSQFSIDTRPWGYFTVIGAVILSLGLILGLVWRLSRRSLTPLLFRALAVMAVGIFPWIFLPDHIYPHYLDLASFGFALLVASLWESLLVSFLLVSAALVSYFAGIRASVRLHLTVQRAVISSHLLPRLEERGLCEGGDVLIDGDPNLTKEASYALSLSNAPAVICKNPSLHVYYQGSYQEEPIARRIILTEEDR